MTSELIKLIKFLSKEQRHEFLSLFSDLDFELNDLGWKGDETTLVNDMIFNHFGFSIHDKDQLKNITDAILDSKTFKSTVHDVICESEALALIPSVKANGLFQLVYFQIKKLMKFGIITVFLKNYKSNNPAKLNGSHCGPKG